MKKKLVLFLAINLALSNCFLLLENVNAETNGNTQQLQIENLSLKDAEFSKQDSESSEQDSESSKYDSDSLENAEITGGKLNQTNEQESETSEYDSKTSEETSKSTSEETNSSSQTTGILVFEEKTYEFNSTYDFCMFLAAKNRQFDTDSDYRARKIKECKFYQENEDSYLTSAGGILVEKNETWIFRNVRMSLSTGNTYIHVHEGGKLIVEGDRTLFIKDGGCAIIGNPKLTNGEIEIRAGTFVSGSGNPSPICYDKGPHGIEDRLDLPSFEEAKQAFLSYIPENSEIVDIADSVERVLTEPFAFSTWIYKDCPTWFYGFNTWKIQIREKKTPEPTEPEELEPTIPDTPDIPNNPEPEKPTEKPAEPLASASTPLIENPNTSVSKKEVSYSYLFAVSSVIFFSILRKISHKRY